MVEQTFSIEELKKVIFVMRDGVVYKALLDESED